MKHLFYSLALALPFAVAANAAVSLNEIRIDQGGADDDEMVEFFTTSPSESLDAHWLLVLGDGAGGSGTIEHVTDLSGNTSSLNHFLVAEATFSLGGVTPGLTTSLNFENSDNVTFLLVKDFTGANGDDLDTDDDGALNVTPWSSVIDAVSLVEDPSGGDKFYAGALGFSDVGPDGTFVPAHVFRDSGTNAWQLGTFATGAETPGAQNPAIPEPSTGVLSLLGALLLTIRRRRA